MVREFKIVAGPSKYDLQKALFDRMGNGNKPHTVTFTNDKGARIVAVILVVAAEDGSGESWNIEGYFTNLTTNRSDVSLNIKFEGYFRTDRRIGHLTEVEDRRMRVRA